MTFALWILACTAYAVGGGLLLLHGPALLDRMPRGWRQDAALLFALIALNAIGCALLVGGLALL